MSRGSKLRRGSKLPGVDGLFDAVRADQDPIRRGREAGRLITAYQQRAVELARLRRAAIEEAHENGMSYTEIAEELDITKGRITQIRSSAPGRERAFFGVGPVAVGIPLRRGTGDGRDRTFYDASDSAARDGVETLLACLAFSSSQFAIKPEHDTAPDGDAVVICGPRSAPVARRLLQADPVLGFERDEAGWWITDRHTGRRYGPRSARRGAKAVDYGYLARHVEEGRVVVHIAGITSVGSLGVVHYLSSHVPDLYDQGGDSSFGAVVECTYDADFAVAASGLAVVPYQW